MLGAERHEVGIACGRCDAFNPRASQFCARCGSDLELASAGQPIQAIAPGTSSTPPKVGSQSIPFGARSLGGSVPDAPRAPVHEERAMDQAKYYVCESCMTPVPSGHKFCGRCGTPVPETMQHQTVDFYGDIMRLGRLRSI